MGSMGEKPGDIDRILAATDPARVKLLLDVAHYQQGGGDPAAAIRKYHDRLGFLHFNDVEPANNAQGYRFVELGRGRVDFTAVFNALDEIGYNGWAVVELDSSTDFGRSAKESAAISKAWLTERGLTLG
jgi:inosose dehydratase